MNIILHGPPADGRTMKAKDDIQKICIPVVKFMSDGAMFANAEYVNTNQIDEGGNVIFVVVGELIPI